VLRIEPAPLSRPFGLTIPDAYAPGTLFQALRASLAPERLRRLAIKRRRRRRRFLSGSRMACVRAVLA